MAEVAANPRGQAPSPAPWYVVRVRKNSLTIAEENLARQGFRTLMPREEVTVRTARGFRRFRRPLFPGYLFLSGGTGRPAWASVRGTRGVADLLYVDGQPARLPPGYADQMAEALDQNGVVASPGGSVAEGDAVRITSGPFADWIAQVVETAPEGRLRMLVQFMDRVVRVDLDRRDVVRHG